MHYIKGRNIINIEYRDRKLQKQCSNSRLAKKDFGVEVADKLLSLINFLDNAKNLMDIAVMRIYHLHPLDRDRKGQFALDLGRRLGWRLLVIPLDHEGKRWSTTEDVNIIYKSTTVILVWEVTKHYE
ncbi:hypothetical protein [Desulfosporosinus sp. FKA]|uniref:hypothetical protein n=1 Tax=Desulfosporosinus sp. FKA TaxID=1969834 RepID=UPI000B49F7D7|nr:hypothetical protein [Desulfosporosinus sp. FKA]